MSQISVTRDSRFQVFTPSYRDAVGKIKMRPTTLSMALKDRRKENTPTYGLYPNSTGV
jgi:hypothetical protein